MDKNGIVILLVIKTVNAILSCGSDINLKRFVHDFGMKFKSGIIKHGFGRFQSHGLSITRHDDVSCSIYCDDKLSALEGVQTTCVRRRQIDKQFNAAE